jgi:hypothetical protein
VACKKGETYEINPFFCIVAGIITFVPCLSAPCTVFLFSSHLQISINAFFETTQKSGGNVLTDGDEGELVGTAR